MCAIFARVQTPWTEQVNIFLTISDGKTFKKDMELVGFSLKWWYFLVVEEYQNVTYKALGHKQSFSHENMNEPLIHDTCTYATFHVLNK